ncbi:hypothetical protein VTI74DRAFT_11316 [Chaetomium olivicolor]
MAHRNTDWARTWGSEEKIGQQGCWAEQKLRAPAARCCVVVRMRAHTRVRSAGLREGGKTAGGGEEKFHGECHEWPYGSSWKLRVSSSLTISRVSRFLDPFSYLSVLQYLFRLRTNNQGSRHNEPTQEGKGREGTSRERAKDRSRTPYDGGVQLLASFRRINPAFWFVHSSLASVWAQVAFPTLHGQPLPWVLRPPFSVLWRAAKGLLARLGSGLIRCWGTTRSMLMMGAI